MGRAAKKGEGTPRDVFLRPMVDLKGAQDRLGFNSTKVALEIEDEFDENRWESQEALKYAGGSPCGPLPLLCLCAGGATTMPAVLRHLYLYFKCTLKKKKQKKTLETHAHSHLEMRI